MRKPHSFRGLNPEQYESLFSNFLIDSWSYSKVNTFARNEKEFEKVYIYNEPSKQSATSVSGSAYHAALEFYFNSVKDDGVAPDLIDLETVAFDYIDDFEAHRWKLQKTTPTVEKAVEAATKNTTKLLNNFLKEVHLYQDDVEEILYVEVYCDEFITVNGVDIQIPCHCKIDVVFKTKSGKIAIVDHKSKSKFSDEQEVSFVIGKQAVTYKHCLEAKFNLTVDEVWFVENKASTNRDKTAPQLISYKVTLDEDTVRLYDAMLYEPLRRMLGAVSDPEHVYLMNESDNFVDKAEIHEFWARTMIAEVDDFNIPESKKELVEKRLKKIRDSSIENIHPNVVKNFKANASKFIQYDYSSKDMTTEEKIVHVLKTHNIMVQVAHTFDVPTSSSNTYLLDVAAGTKIKDVFKYKLDIANAVGASSVRIHQDLFMHNNKSYLAVETPKKRTENLLYNPSDRVDLKIPIGKDNLGNVVYWDLNNQSTPHSLVCGATGSGKSVAIINALEHIINAGLKDIIILDPKFEFIKYKNTPGVEVCNSIDDIETMMELMVEEMEHRVEYGINHKKVIIFDEFADAISNSRKGNELKVYEMEQVGTYQNGKPKMKRVHVDTKKSLEQNLGMLAQKGRSSGFRILAATQRASVKVITGDTKVNFPVQICFRVPKKGDSMVVLDEVGAEHLNGQGDGLIRSPEYLNVVRFQSYYKP